MRPTGRPFIFIIGKFFELTGQAGTCSFSHSVQVLWPFLIFRARILNSAAVSSANTANRMRRNARHPRMLSPALIVLRKASMVQVNGTQP